MKRILRYFFENALALYFITQVASGMVFSLGTTTFLQTAFVLALVSLLAKPVINLLLLPLNLITFGVFRWVSSAITLFIVTLIIPQFKIIGFNFTGLTSKWLDLPELHFTGFLAYIAFSLLLSIVISFFQWLTK